MKEAPLNTRNNRVSEGKMWSNVFIVQGAYRSLTDSSVV